MSRSVRVYGKLIGYDDEILYLNANDPDHGDFPPLGDDDVKMLLDALVQGKFTQVRGIFLVSCAVFVCGVVRK
jgi:hypothetical protein